MIKTSRNSRNVSGVNKAFVVAGGQISSTTHEWIWARNSDMFSSEVS